MGTSNMEPMQRALVYMWQCATKVSGPFCLVIVGGRYDLPRARSRLHPT